MACGRAIPTSARSALLNTGCEKNEDQIGVKIAAFYSCLPKMMAPVMA